MPGRNAPITKAKTPEEKKKKTDKARRRRELTLQKKNGGVPMTIEKNRLPSWLLNEIGELPAISSYNNELIDNNIKAIEQSYKLRDVYKEDFEYFKKRVFDYIGSYGIQQTMTKTQAMTMKAEVRERLVIPTMVGLCVSLGITKHKLQELEEINKEYKDVLEYAGHCCESYLLDATLTKGANSYIALKLLEKKHGWTATTDTNTITGVVFLPEKGVAPLQEEAKEVIAVKKIEPIPIVEGVKLPQRN